MTKRIIPILKNRKISVTRPVAQSKETGEKEVKKEINKAEQPIPNFSSIATSIPSTFSTVKSKPYEAISKTNTKDPKIIAISDFIPVYRVKDELNDAGKLLQIKQDALLLSAADAVKRILLQLSEDETTKDFIEEEKNSLLNFCKEFGGSISWVLSCLETAKINLNNFTIDDSTQQNFKILNSYFEDINIPTINEIFSLANSSYNWTNTKTWIQACLEFKDALNYGVGKTPNLFFIPQGNPSWEEDRLKDPYKFLQPFNTKNKLKFNQNQLILPSFFNKNYLVAENFNTLKPLLQNVFERSDYSPFNIKMSDFFTPDNYSSSEKAKRLAQLSYIICREIKFSTEIRRIGYVNKKIIEDYGYSEGNISTTRNVDFLNHIIGECGDDITEVSQTPKGQGRSLMSLSQFSTNDNEILTFEKRYLNDDINNDSNSVTRKESVLTPGTAYFIDSALNFDIERTTGFNTTNAQQYLTRLDNALFALNKLMNGGDNKGMLFNKNILPRNNEELIGAISNEQAQSAASLLNNFSLALRHPLLMVRLIEQRILTTLLPRQGTPASISNSKAKDFTPVFISLGLQNPEILSLIYTYVIAGVNSTLNKMDTATYSDASYQRIITNSLKQTIINKFQNVTNNTPSRTEVFHDLNQVINALYSQNTLNQTFKILNDVIQLMAEIYKEFSKTDPTNSEDLKRLDPVPFNNSADNTNSLSYYSGIQKEAIMTGIFYLCCLMIHDANPDKIVGLQTITAQGNASKVYKLKIQNKGPGSSVGSLKGQITINNLVEFGGTAVGGVRSINAYYYDDVIASAETQIWKETISLKQLAARFICHLQFLYTNLNSFIDNLNVLPNSSIGDLQSIIQIFKNEFGSNVEEANIKINELMTIEQLSLLKSKLSYLGKRLSDEYNSELRNVAPYFVSAKDDPNFELSLPLEDFELVSWNYLLKEFFNDFEFTESFAANKKILSIGLPAKLYASLQNPVDASKLQESRNPNNIIKIKIYMVDNLRPLLVHKPLEFLFDMSKFAVKSLNYFTDSKFISGISSTPTALEPAGVSSYKNIKYFPLINLRNNPEADALAEDAFAFKYFSNNPQLQSSPIFSTLNSNEDVRNLFSNHIKSFALEQYLKFVSGHSFDETNFFKTSLIKRLDESFITSLNAPTLGSFEYLKTNHLAVGQQVVKSSLLQPKKFDRVFHLLIDPDDFEIDEQQTTSNSNQIGENVIDFYKNLGIIFLSQNKLKRKSNTRKQEVEFYSFKVTVETYR